MLPHYSPFKVAETFSVLGGLHGKRIDLGIGRAPGSDLETIIALQRDRRQLLPDDFLEQVGELLAYFEDGFPPDAPVRQARPPARRAGHGRGLAARDVRRRAPSGRRSSVCPTRSPTSSTPRSAPAGLLYRERFTPSRRLKQPQVSVAVGVVCAETDEEAERHASSWRMAITLAERGQFGPLPTVTRALAFLAGEAGVDTFAGRRVVVGSPDTVRPALEQIVADYGADELMIHTLMHNHAARRRSYELIAEAFGLTADRSKAKRKPASLL